MGGREKRRADQYSNYPTLKLAKQMVAASHRHERIVHAGWLSHPVLRVTRRWAEPRAVENKRIALRILLERYRTVIVQVLQRGGLAHQNWMAASRVIGEHIRTEVLRTRDYRWCAPLLWDAVVRQLDDAGRRAVEPLKAKFMLLQFVDQMPAGAPRDLLSKAAYDENAMDFPSDGFEILNDAYRQLHTAVGRFRRDLGLLTDGALTPDWLAEADRSPLLYEELLFHTFLESEAEDL